MAQHLPLAMFTANDGKTRLQILMQEDSLWLTQKQIAELFERSPPTINEHLKNIYEEGELEPDATIRKFRIVALEGASEVERLLDHYNLDAVLSVIGYLCLRLIVTRKAGWFCYQHMWMAQFKPEDCKQTPPPTPVFFSASRLYLKQESALPCPQTAKPRLLPAQFAGANGQIMYGVITERFEKRESKTKLQSDQLPDKPGAAGVILILTMLNGHIFVPSCDDPRNC